MTDSLFPTHDARPPGLAEVLRAPVPKERLVVATDGSALGNPGPGGWAWFVSEERWAAGGEVRTTNNRMELMAVAELLAATDADQPLRVLADSRYVIDACTKWVHGWRRRGWRTADGKPVANRELIEPLCAELGRRSVEFVWVRGHAGHALNEAADDVARRAAQWAQRGQPRRLGPGA